MCMKLGLILTFLSGGENVCSGGDDFPHLLVSLPFVFRVRVSQQGYCQQTVRARPVLEFLLVSDVQLDGESDHLLLDEPEVSRKSRSW